MRDNGGTLAQPIVNLFPASGPATSFFNGLHRQKQIPSSQSTTYFLYHRSSVCPRFFQKPPAKGKPAKPDIPTNIYPKKVKIHHMQPKFITILVVTASLILTASCKQKVKTEAEIAVAPADSYHPFVIAPRLVNQGGAYELLAIVDGVDATAQLARNLQLLRAQRAALRQLKEQADQNDEVKKKTGDLEKKLEQNAAMMLKIYGYKTSAEHIFLPVRSALVEVTDGKKELIKEINSPAEHRKLQSMRAKYAELTKKGEANSDEARTLEQKLIKEFSYDVKSNYKIDIYKAALYRKVN